MTNKNFPNLKKYPPYIRHELRKKKMAFNIPICEYAYLKVGLVIPSFRQRIRIHISGYEFFACLDANWKIGEWFKRKTSQSKPVEDLEELALIDRCLQSAMPKIRSAVAKQICRIRKVPSVIEGTTTGDVIYSISDKGVEIEDMGGHIAEIQITDLKKIYDAARKFLTNKRKRDRKVKSNNGDL